MKFLVLLVCNKLIFEKSVLKEVTLIYMSFGGTLQLHIATSKL